jgi:hypothetical protein
MLGLSGVLALRATITPPSSQLSEVDPGADDIVLVNLTAKTDRLPAVDENEKKIVSVERFHLSALQANAKADPEPKPEIHHRRRVFRHHWHHRLRTVRRH